VLVPVVAVDVTVNVALEAPAVTVTFAGTVTAAVFELVKVTSAPAAGATPFSVTVAVDVEDLTTELGLSTSAYAVVTGETVRLCVFVTVESVAEIVLDPEAPAAVDTIKVASVAPARTVTLAGTVAMDVCELVSEMAVPPDGAAAERVTVPVAPKSPTTLDWFREREVRVCANAERPKKNDNAAATSKRPPSLGKLTKAPLDSRRHSCYSRSDDFDPPFLDCSHIGSASSDVKLTLTTQTRLMISDSQWIKRVLHSKMPALRRTP
jgi:hypothetical protein